MTKFYNYINESNLDKLIESLEKNCQPFIKDLKRLFSTDFLYSGRSTSDDWFKKKVRQNRRPLNTPLYIHKILDNWFKEKFGIKVRSSSLFCSFDEKEAVFYGNVYMIFPIGSYKMIYSPEIEDLYNEMTYLWRDGDFYKKTRQIFDNFDKIDKKRKSEFKKLLIERLEKSNYKKGKIEYTDNEVMLHCKECYMVSKDKYEEDLKNYFFKGK